MSKKTNSFANYLADFDSKFRELTEIDNTFYLKEIGVHAEISKAKTKDKRGQWSEEYIRARFVYALVKSGLYNKEYLCVEFQIPKGNGGKSINPDIVVFKNKDWLIDYSDAKSKKNFSKIRQNILAIFETKKNDKSVESAIENQLRVAMEINTSKDRIFGIYFDDKDDVLIFKKIGNSEISRFYENEELNESGLVSWNLESRDSISKLPSQTDLNENNSSIEDLTKLRFDSLDAIDEKVFSDLMNALKRASDSIKPESDEHYLIVEFLTLKIYDEKRAKRDNQNLKFYILDGEKKKDGTATEAFRSRINELYKEAEKEYPNVIGGEKRVFKYDEAGRPSRISDEKFLVGVVENFQRRAILKAKNESFNQIIFNNFADSNSKINNDQFYTPIPVVKTIIRIVNPQRHEEICDPCCGICDFPAMAFKHSNKIENQASSNLYGFDITKSNIKLAELNLVLNGDGGAILKEMDSLSQKLLKDGSVIKPGDFNVKNYDPLTWKNRDDSQKDIKQFKIITTNPPFGKGRDLKVKGDRNNQDLMEMYETYKVKGDKDDKGTINYPNSMDMGALFLENAYKLLEEGGRMSIVLSNSLASISEWKNVRKWFIERMRIVAIFDLPSNTFGETGVATTVIIAYKPKKGEEKLLTNNYKVYVKEIEKIGYEVKTVKRTVSFKPSVKIDLSTFEKTNKLDEDFSEMLNEFKDYLNDQEEEIKNAFHSKDMD